MLVKSTSSLASRESVSCTIAIDLIRRSDSWIASRASSDLRRLPCKRSSAAMVCRLFLTRWCTSRIVASLDISMRSLRRRSVTSRIKSRAPTGSSSSNNGIIRISTEESERSISCRTGRRPRIALSTEPSSNPSCLISVPEI